MQLPFLRTPYHPCRHCTITTVEEKKNIAKRNLILKKIVFKNLFKKHILEDIIYFKKNRIFFHKTCSEMFLMYSENFILKILFYSICSKMYFINSEELCFEKNFRI